ncbi:2,3-bisphosphoglycerate-independent phosphoglycerate mutase [Desulfitispora alkaliphila]|uniref:2,3-bisphosphoglycerate-independent phosphoglycerate mutase n=1 Tax=Desulfitispora alkaliphila TaxID=622674 RepID=UPI003D197601
MLMILDGYGMEDAKKGNAIAAASTPNWERLWNSYPNTTLVASGERVGLPQGQMGNSEVGHLNIGAGRVVYQELTRISKAIKTGEFSENEQLLKVMDQVKQKNSSLHLMGLLSDGGVHSHIEHLYALLEMAKEKGIEKVYIHAFLDGRDVGPRTGKGYIEQVDAKCQEIKCGKLATVIGRYYAMDRDKRWERSELAYNALVVAEGEKAVDPVAAVENSYAQDVTDEFVKPIVVTDEKENPVASINDGDGVIFFNFRADRARQITRCFVDKEFEGFKRKKPVDVSYCCFTQYDATIAAPVAFPPQVLENTFGQVLSKNELKQLRIAETEKYAHVTFFFNGGVEKAEPGEERVLIPSPSVATYDMKPEMSAPEVTERVIKELDKGEFDVIVLNYANPDMVGHTGDFDAAVKAVEVVDQCLGKVIDKVLELGGNALLTADHGNAEQMVGVEEKPHTAHTSNVVPMILVSEKLRSGRLKQGRALEDIAPTLLAMLEIDKPAEMTGTNIITEEE